MNWERSACTPASRARIDASNLAVRKSESAGAPGSVSIRASRDRRAMSRGPEKGKRARMIQDSTRVGPSSPSRTQGARALLLAVPRRKHHGKLSDVRRSEEHTSELQSRENLVCRHLIEIIIMI